MKCGTDTPTADVSLCMSTETVAPADVSTETNTVVENPTKFFFVVPVLTCAFVVLAGSTLFVVAPPEPGSLAFGVVGTTMVGAVVGGFLGVTTVLVASFVVPVLDVFPEPEEVLRS